MVLHESLTNHLYSLCVHLWLRTMSLLKLSTRTSRHFVFGHSSTLYLLKGIKKGLKEKGLDYAGRLKAIREKAKELVNQNSDLIVDGASRGHVEFSSHILASYLCLLSDFNGNQQETVSFIKTNTMAAYDNWMIRKSFQFIFWLCKDDVAKLNSVFSWMMNQYGASFTWESPKEDKRLLHLKIHRCFYFEFFKKHDALFLMPILCQLDGIWFEMIDPKKHGFVFDKKDYQTQGYGADVCIFPVKKIGLIDSSGDNLY